MLSIIIVNYNDSSHIKKCLFSLQNQTYKDFEIIMIENNSKDKYIREILSFLKNHSLNKEFLKKIKYFRLTKKLEILGEDNLGFAGGSNLGVKKSRGDLILFLNNDTIHESTFLESMVNFFDKFENLHIAQPIIFFHSYKDIVWSNGGKINPFAYHLFTHFNHLEKLDSFYRKPFKIDYAVGCALFIRRDILRKIGLFDENYFMYCEESDLCYRARLNGYNNIFCNSNAKIYHNIKQGYSKSFKKFYFRNRLIFCLKFFPTYLVVWQFLMQFIQLIEITSDFKAKKIDYKFFFQSIKGIIDGFKTGLRLKLKNNS